MTFKARILSAIFPLVLFACANNTNNDSNLYRPEPGLTPASAASLVGSQLDTGFLFFGITHITIDSVDRQIPTGGRDRPLLLTPGPHAILIRAFQDPVAAYACVSATFEAGKTYVARATAPNMDKTTMWLEDSATGEIVSQKVDGKMMRDPLMWGPGLKALFVGPVPTSC
jgi:hypothetical protein